MDLHNLFNVVSEQVFLDYCGNITSDLHRLYMFECCFDDCIEEAVKMIV